MNRKFLLVSLLSITLVHQILGDDRVESPTSVTQTNAREFSPIEQASLQEPRAITKPLFRRVSSTPIVSPEKRMEQVKNAASNSSPLKNIASQNFEQAIQSNSIAGVNPLAKTLKAAELEVGQATQPKKRVTTQTRISDQGKQQTVQTIINPDNSTTVLTTDAATKQVVSRVTTDAQGAIIPKETWYKDSFIPTSTASKKLIPLRQSLVRANQNIRTNPSMPTEQVQPSALADSDVAFENVYAPEKMNTGIMHYGTSPLNKDLTLENIYDPATMDYSHQIMEYADSPSWQLNFKDIHDKSSNNVKSSLGEFTGDNPTRQNKPTDVVVYDPEQKYQKPLGLTLPEPLAAGKNQVIINKFKGATPLALRNYQQNNQATNMAQDFTAQTTTAPGVELFDWAQNVKIPTGAQSNSNMNSLSGMQTQSALDSRNQMLEGFKNQAKVQQAKIVQQALQSKKPISFATARAK